jgi:hypothetical protein
MLLKRDMIASMRGFESRQKMWAYKAERAPRAPGMAEYAAKKSNFYRVLKEDVVKRCDKHVKVSIVLLAKSYVLIPACRIKW